MTEESEPKIFEEKIRELFPDNRQEIKRFIEVLLKRYNISRKVGIPLGFIGVKISFSELEPRKYDFQDIENLIWKINSFFYDEIPTSSPAINYLGEKTFRGESSTNKDNIHILMNDEVLLALEKIIALIAHLTKEDQGEDEPDKHIEKLEFDEKDSILHFASKTITISKNIQSDPHDLLRTLFKDTSKTWNNDEIIVDWGYLADEKPVKNKIYQAGKAVNQIIAQETTINDFLDVSTKTIAINKKYLKV